MISVSFSMVKKCFSIFLKGLKNPGKAFCRDEIDHDNPFIIF